MSLQAVGPIIAVWSTKTRMIDQQCQCVTQKHESSRQCIVQSTNCETPVSNMSNVKTSWSHCLRKVRCYLFVYVPTLLTVAYLLTCLLAYLLTCLLTCLLAYLLTCLLVYLLTCLLAYLLTCLLTTYLSLTLLPTPNLVLTHTNSVAHFFSPSHVLTQPRRCPLPLMTAWQTGNKHVNMCNLIGTNATLFHECSWPNFNSAPYQNKMEQLNVKLRQDPDQINSNCIALSCHRPSQGHGRDDRIAQTLMDASWQIQGRAFLWSLPISIPSDASSSSETWAKKCLPTKTAKQSPGSYQLHIEWFTISKIGS